MDSSSTPAARWARWLPALALAGAALVQFLALPNGYIGKEHDDALYVLAAQAVSHGEYRLFFAPGRPPIDLTPGLPALLAPVAFLFGENLAAFQIACWALLALCNVAVWLWLKRRHSPATALTLALFFALNPLILSRAGVVMPEAPFLLVAMLALLLWDRPAAAGGLSLAAYLIRPGALPLLGALWAANALRRRWRALAVTALIPVAGWALWNFLRPEAAGAQDVNAMADSYAGFRFSQIWGVVKANILGMTRTLGMTFLPRSIADTGAAVPAGAPLAALALAGLGKTLLKKPSDPGALFFLGTLGMNLVWPWWYERYMLPLLPLVLSFAVTGLPARARVKKTSALAAGGLVLALQFAWQGRFIASPKPYDNRPPLEPVYALLREKTAPWEAISSPFFGTDALYAGRPFHPLWLPGAGETPAAVGAMLSGIGIRYIMWYRPADLGYSTPEVNPFSVKFERLEKLLKDPAVFAPVHRDDVRGLTIYKILSAPPASPAPARPARSLPASAPPA